MGFLNVGSFVLGLVAWILPIINLLKRDEVKHENWFIFSMLSICACAISLYMQILYNNYLVEITDWSALMDTSSAVAFVSSVLIAITIFLNVITVIVYKKSIKNNIHK